MPKFTGPVKYRDALRAIHAKAILPTDLSAEELMQIGGELRGRSLFSAKVALASWLQDVKDVVEKILTPKQVKRGDQTVTEGTSIADGRELLRQSLKKLGYEPKLGETGTIKDLTSDARLNLIINTQLAMARGYGYWKQGQTAAVINAWPAQEFYRAEDRIEPRDWPQRWQDAGGLFYTGQSDYPQGRMIALKSSPIWRRINAFGNVYAPFDFNSGMDLRDIPRKEAIALKLMNKDQTFKPQEDPFNAKLHVPELDDDMKQALIDSLGDDYAFEGDVLTWNRAKKSAKHFLSNRGFEEDEHPRDRIGRFAKKGSVKEFWKRPFKEVAKEAKSMTADELRHALSDNSFMEEADPHAVSNVRARLHDLEALSLWASEVEEVPEESSLDANKIAEYMKIKWNQSDHEAELMAGDYGAKFKSVAKAVEYWKGSGYSVLNYHPDNPNSKRIINAINAIKPASHEETGKHLWRGSSWTKGRVDEIIANGGVFEIRDRAAWSVSSDPEIAKNFVNSDIKGDPSVLIRVRKWKSARNIDTITKAQYGNDESEYVFPRGARFKITGESKTDGWRVVEIEELDGDKSLSNRAASTPPDWCYEDEVIRPMAFREMYGVVPVTK